MHGGRASNAIDFPHLLLPSLMLLTLSAGPLQLRSIAGASWLPVHLLQRGHNGTSWLFFCCRALGSSARNIVST